MQEALRLANRGQYCSSRKSRTTRIPFRLKVTEHSGERCERSKDLPIPSEAGAELIGEGSKDSSNFYSVHAHEGAKAVFFLYFRS